MADESGVVSLLQMTRYPPANTTWVYKLEFTRTMLVVVFAIVTVLGIIGNSLVILAILLSRKLRSPTNWLILNLACADLLSSLYLPVLSVSLLSHIDWVIPGWLCVIFTQCIYVFVGVSITTHASISFTRWYLITRNQSKFNQLLKTRNMFIIIVFCWVHPIVWVQIYEIPHQFKRFSVNCYFYFLADYTVSPDLLSDILAGLWVFFNFTLIVTFYVKIFRFVRQQQRKIRGVRHPRQIMTEHREQRCSDQPGMHMPVHGPDLRIFLTPASLRNNHGINISSTIPSGHVTAEHNQNTREPTIHRKFIDVTKNLLVVVIAFSICFVPFLISASVPIFSRVMPWSSLLLISNSLINPIIYARKIPAFREVMSCILRCRLSDIPMPVDWLRRRTRSARNWERNV